MSITSCIAGVIRLGSRSKHLAIMVYVFTYHNYAVVASLNSNTPIQERPLKNT